MRKPEIEVVLLSAALAMCTGACPAEDGWSDLGLGVGIPIGRRNNGFDTYQVFADHALPWRWGSDWELGTRLRMSAGVLRDGGDTGLLGAIGPVLTLRKRGFPLFSELGVRAVLLSQHDFEDNDLGGPVQFLSHLGLGISISPHLALSCRIEHMSNADLYTENPGIELQEIGLAYRF